MNHWAVRSEMAQRCSLLASQGGMPKEVPLMHLTALRVSTRQLPESILYAPFSLTRWTPPPLDSADRVFSAFRVALRDDPILVKHMTQSQMQTFHALARHPDIPRLIGDLFWAALLEDIVIPRRSQGSHGTNLPTGGSSSSVPRTRPSSSVSVSSRRSVLPSHAVKSLTISNQKRAADEIFAAACRDDVETLNVETFNVLLSKILLQGSGGTVIALLSEISSEESRASGRRPPTQLSTVSNDNSHDGGGSLYGSSPRRAQFSTSNRFRDHGDREAVIDEDDGDATNFDSTTCSVTITKRDFVHWVSVEPLRFYSVAALKEDVAAYVCRAQRTYKTLLSPFHFSLELRDMLSLPFCYLCAAVVSTLLRSTCGVEEEDTVREMSGDEERAMTIVLESEISYWLLERRIPRISRRMIQSADSSASRTGASGAKTSREKSAQLVTGREDSSYFGSTVASNILKGTSPDSEDLKSLLFKFSKAGRLGAHGTAAATSHVKPPSTIDDKTIKRGNASASDRGTPPKATPHPPQRSPSPTRELLSPEDSFVMGSTTAHLGHRRRNSYRSLQTLLKVTDEEVKRELGGAEANVQRATAYIAAQQKLSTTGIPLYRQRQMLQSAIQHEGEGDNSSSQHASLEAMLQEEKRPECVRAAVRTQSSRGELFDHSHRTPIPPSERLVILQEKSKALASQYAANDRHSARRHTAHVGDVASATSQRTISKHARRLYQQQEVEKVAAEKRLERHAAALINDFNNVCKEFHKLRHNEEDAKLFRGSLQVLQVEFDGVLADKHFLFLKDELRLTVLGYATRVGKQLRTLNRMRDHHLYSDDDDDDGATRESGVYSVDE